jgi:hypothetical protein
VPFKVCNLQISMAVDSRNSTDSPLRRPDVCQKVLGLNGETVKPGSPIFLLCPSHSGLLIIQIVEVPDGNSGTTLRMSLLRR